MFSGLFRRGSNPIALENSASLLLVLKMVLLTPGLERQSLGPWGRERGLMLLSEVEASNTKARRQGTWS